MKSDLFKLPRLPVLFDASIRLAGFAMAVAGVVLAGHSLTELSAPRPVAKLPAMVSTLPDAGSRTITQMFGTSETHQSVEGLSLTGVFAGSHGGGFATFRSPNGAVSVFPGEEVVAGVKLNEIKRDRVILQSAESMKELLLSTEATGPSAGPTQAPNQAVQADDAASNLANAVRRRQHNRPGDDE